MSPRNVGLVTNALSDCHRLRQQTLWQQHSWPEFLIGPIQSYPNFLIVLFVGVDRSFLRYHTNRRPLRYHTNRSSLHYCNNRSSLGYCTNRSSLSCRTNRSSLCCRTNSSSLRYRNRRSLRFHTNKSSLRYCNSRSSLHYRDNSSSLRYHSVSIKATLLCFICLLTCLLLTLCALPSRPIVSYSTLWLWWSPTFLLPTFACLLHSCDKVLTLCPLSTSPSPSSSSAIACLLHSCDNISALFPLSPFILAHCVGLSCQNVDLVRTLS